MSLHPALGRERRIADFEDWLRAAGADILATTNEHEVLRWRCSLGAGVIYRGRRGLSANGPMATEAVECFVRQRRWAGKAAPTKRRNQASPREQLKKRDGERCFYCERTDCLPLTVEHLIPVSAGGPDTLGNKVLAGRACNEALGHMTLVEKLRRRDALRARCPA